MRSFLPVFFGSGRRESRNSPSQGSDYPSTAAESLSTQGCERWITWELDPRQIDDRKEQHLYDSRALNTTMRFKPHSATCACSCKVFEAVVQVEAVAYWAMNRNPLAGVLVAFYHSRRCFQRLS